MPEYMHLSPCQFIPLTCRGTCQIHSIHTVYPVHTELGKILAFHRTEANQEGDKDRAWGYKTANMFLSYSCSFALLITASEKIGCKRSRKVTIGHIYALIMNGE